MNTPRHRRNFLLLATLVLLGGIGAAYAQYDWAIDEIALDNTNGAESPTPFIADWVSQRLLSMTIGCTDIATCRIDTVLMYCRLTNATGELIAETNQYQNQPILNGEFLAVTRLSSDKIPFLRPSIAEGGWQFARGSASDRLPPGTYTIEVTLYRWQPGLSGPPQSTWTVKSQPARTTFSVPPRDRDFELDVVVNEPSPYFEDWERPGSRAAEIAITSVWRHNYTAYPVYLDQGVLESTPGTNVRVATRANEFRNNRISLSGVTKTIHTNQIPLFDRTIPVATRMGYLDEMRGFDPNVHRFPEGSYHLCFALKEAGTEEIIGRFQCSEPFAVENPEPPECVSPVDSASAALLPMFRWTHTIAPERRTHIKYSIEILPGIRGVTPDETFRRASGIIPVKRDNISGTTYNLLSRDPLLIPGRVYVWRVKATLPGSTTAFSANDGYSESAVFTYGSTENPANLLSPIDEETAGTPITFDWSDVRPPEGSAVTYLLKVRALAEGETPSATLFDRPGFSAVTVSGASRYTLPADGSSPLRIVGNRHYVWRVDVQNSRNETDWVRDGGKSEIATFIAPESPPSAGAIEGGSNSHLTMYYPAPGEYVPDQKPPFCAYMTLNRDTVWHLTVTITEISQSGTPLGAAQSFTGTSATSTAMTSTDLITLVNHQGSASRSENSRGILTPETGFTTVPGKRYRWTLQVRKHQDSAVAAENSANFRALPYLSHLESTVPSLHITESRLSYRASRRAPGYGLEPHPFTLRAVVMSNSRGTVFERNTILRFPVLSGNPGEVEEVAISHPLAALGSGSYRWCVQSLYGENIVGVSDTLQLVVESQLCGCVCVKGIYPEQTRSSTPLTPVSTAWPGNFIIGFTPAVTPRSAITGTITIWKRQVTEDAATVATRTPTFTGAFTIAPGTRPTGTGTSATLTQFDVTPRTTAGAAFIAHDTTAYLYKIETNFNPVTIRTDSANCAPTARAISEYHTFYVGPVASASVIPECNPAVTNRTGATSLAAIADTVRIGGFKLALDRSSLTFTSGGVIAGQGSVIKDSERWAVAFTSLHINTSNEVFDGVATARTRTLPADISSAIAETSDTHGLNAFQVSRIAECWSTAASIFTGGGDRMVPFGVNLDLGAPSATIDSGMAVKFAIVKATFEARRAFYDAVAGVRVPLTTTDGAPKQWVGMYAQNIPFCKTEGSRWRTALRHLGDNKFGSPGMTGWEFTIKGSVPEPMDSTYLLGPGDGSGIVISDRGFEQLHMEVAIAIPRNVFVPGNTDSSGNWVDQPTGRVVRTGTLDITRSGYSAGDDPQGRPITLGGGFYLVADLPACRIATSQFRIAAIDITFDFSSSWSPRATAGRSYMVPGVAIPTTGAAFSRADDWQGLFIRECSMVIPGFGNTPIGVQNLFSSSPVSFTAFAAPMQEATFGNDVKLRLDTIDFSINRGNFERARIKTSMVFPGAMEGRIGLDFAYQQMPEPDSAQTDDPAPNSDSTINSFIISLNAPEAQVYKITDFLDITIKRGSQVNVSYSDRPPTPGGSRWGFAFDLSGGMELVKRKDGVKKISIGGLEYENFRYASNGSGITAPRITLLGVPLPTGASPRPTADTMRYGDTPKPPGDSASSSDSTKKSVGGFPIGISSLGLTFTGDGMQLGISTVVTVALTGEDGGPCFGGALGISLSGALAMREGHPVWGAPELKLDSLRIAFESDALTIKGGVNFYSDDSTWGDGFRGNLEVGMAKIFSANADISFGKKANYRYWYVDADLTIITQTSPMSIGVVGVFGFRGGAYQHMNVSLERNTAGAITGVTYVPTADNTFGIMAGVHLGVNGNPSSFHTKIALSAAFRDARLTNIALSGRGWFMCDLQQECNTDNDSWVNLTATYDFDASRFHLLAAGAIRLKPILSIEAPPGGSIEVLFEPDNWHVYLGRGPFGDPESKPVSATFFPDFAKISVDSYLMAGNALSLNIGGIPLQGGGFATGARVEINIDQTFLIFYGKVYGLFQAEMAIMQLDEASRDCIRGVNGWYMLADLQLAIGLEVGMDIDLWVISGRYEIFKAYMGVQFLVGGPNPTFADGDAKGEFSILDGLVTGSFHYHLHVGDPVPLDCITDALDARTRMPDPIVSVEPKENATNVSVFTTIGLGFALREGEVITVTKQGIEKKARFRLLPSLIVQSARDTIKNGTLQILPGRQTAEWTTPSVLNERTVYTITAIAVAEELQGSAWVEQKRQTKTWSFTTGLRPRDIYQPQIIAATYPLDRQRYSYISGHEGRHYVALAKDMNYLFGNMKRNQHMVAQYTSQTLTKKELPITYMPYGSGCPSMLVIDNPELAARTIYHVRLIRRTTFSNDKNTAYVPATMDTVSMLSNAATRGGGKSFGAKTPASSGSGLITADRVQGNASSRIIQREGVIDTVVYDWFFATGQFSTPQEKMGAMTLQYKSSLGEWVVLTLGGPEPIDDNLHATSLVTFAQEKSNPATNWFNKIWATDHTLRDYLALTRSLGVLDASKVARHLIDHGSRNQIQGMMYVDATAPWTFSNSTADAHKLDGYELRFETMSPAAFGRASSYTPIFSRSMTTARSTPPAATTYKTDVVVVPVNAYKDFNHMRYLYGDLASNGFPVSLAGGAGTGREPLAARISEASVAAIKTVSQKRWTPRPPGTYSLMILSKSFSWTRQSLTEGTGPRGRMKDLERLEDIGRTGNSSSLTFGRNSCGESGKIPFVTLEARIP